MKQLYVTNRDAWRDWLSHHHATETGVWLVFYKTDTGKPTIPYGAAVEEALCFGWIDSIIKRVDAARYARKFTPRRDHSNWSELNKSRADTMIAEGRMTDSGLVKIRSAKASGLWDQAPRPRGSLDIPPELAKALGRNKTARENFDALAPSYRKHYIAWIAVAKRAETRQRRVRESIALLAQGRKLGMK